MGWLEVSVTVRNEAAESVAEVLSRFAHHGVAIEAGPDGWNAGPVIVRAYLPADDRLRASKRRVEEALWHLGQIQPIPAPSFHPVAEEDWVEVWKDRLDVLRIGQRIVIQPSWREFAPMPGDIVIQLDPGMAFGTGLHPTTQMCLAALEEVIQSGADVLDLGTGSGILAIAAAKLGAGHVTAVDNDPDATRAARENVAANHVQENISVIDGSLPEAPGSYDLVVVNILARVIVQMAQEGLVERLRPGGTLIAAGVLADQESGVIAAMEKARLAVTQRWQMDDWVCLAAA
jgi:ribosomal protein L11 methyltransferase